MRAHVAAAVLAALAASVALAGCVYTGAVPLAPNLWRLETRGDGAEGLAFTQEQVMRDAAWLTIRNGYTHFRIVEAKPGGLDHAPARALLYGQSRMVVFGSTAGIGDPAPPPTAGAVAPPTVRRAVDVEMLREGDPAARGAYEAAAVLGWK